MRQSVHRAVSPGGPDLKHRAAGFTLIELMIVATIIGTLAAIAIPAYQNYVTRAKVSEGLRLAAPLKSAITEFYELEGAFPADNAEAHLPPADEISGQYTRSVEVIEDGAIRITFKDLAIFDQTVTLTPAVSGGTLIWSCSTTLPASLTPQVCR
jgi:type IV pilus assembly protein PilA